jgi:23S rRNA pseudouridine955/2504/2580 synthase/23S rRNA pseudouridine1911/1915/1917 synthase
MLDLLLNTDDFVAVMKPAHLATIPGRGEVDSVLEQLAAQLNLPWTGPQDPRLRVVHRLDKDTSGVLLFAKHIDAQRHVSHQFQNNTVRKEYLAVVIGKVAGDRGEIDAPLAVHPTDKKRMCVTKHGRRAITTWQVEERFRIATLLRCFPRTGKTHQIRIHLQHLGHPLLIDPLYGSREPVYLSKIKRGYRTSEREERPLIARLTLHAHRLTFTPITGEPLTIEAEAPKDLRSLLNQLRKM